MTAENAAITSEKKMAVNPYLGQGVILGRRDELHQVQVYWIMGRRTSSRNRRFLCDGGRVYTAIVDDRIPADPLTLYDAALEANGTYAVSNGHQTRAVLEARGDFRILNDFVYEPDAPNYTPRISGYIASNGGRKHKAGLSILRRSIDGSCERAAYLYERLPIGYGYCITTYAWDGDPIPSFVGEPYLVRVGGCAPHIATHYWSLLNKDNRVALMVKIIHEPTGKSEVTIINRHGGAE